jgi:diguanylate cyclase (GGDEF)-like protein/PAS domain S-box-containing protein
MKILIADDDAMSLRLLQRTLERAAYDVIPTRNGQQAADELCKPDGPRLALLDWVMPGMDGPDICREVRKLRNQQYVHLVLLTAKNSKDAIVEGLESGADDYLIKPFDPAELQARLQTGQRILDLEDKLVRAREHMRFRATHDPLTSLFNRGAILDLLTGELTRTAREDGCTTLLMADLDNFKEINDLYGHLVGDEALREVARRLLRYCRSYDYVGRYGGEEFLVVLNNCDARMMPSRAEEMRAVIESTPIKTQAGPLKLTVSIGALASRGCQLLTAEEALRDVDAALYAAKHAGRNCVRLARPGTVMTGVSTPIPRESPPPERVHNREMALPPKVDAVPELMARTAVGQETSTDEEAAMLRMVLASLPVLVYVKDRASKFLLANPPVAQRMGAGSPEELIGRDDFNYFPYDLAKQFFDDEQAILQSGQPMLDHLERSNESQGLPTWMLTSKVPFRDARGQLAGIIGIGVDVTAQKRAEEEMVKARRAAEEASRAKSEFLANMSHEIRTPLNGVIGMTELTLDTELTEEQREYLEAVKLSADSLLNVINDILDFSKIEAGRVDIEAIEFDLRESVEATMKTLALRAYERGLELLCDIAPDVPEVVYGDSLRLRQILLNLIGNAIKFTAEGEVGVRLEVMPRQGEACLLHFAVSDTGIGISQEKQALIFDPFTQADASTTREFGGTGLGLTITKRLVTMMEGNIWVESDLGKGSTFHFTIPVPLGKISNLPSTPSASLEALLKKRVLVVEDNQTNRRILEGMLTRFGMRPTIVESGKLGLAALDAAHSIGEPYDLVITDMHMPQMDGMGFIENVRQSFQQESCPIMMLTSGAYGMDAARGRELKLAAYLTKPVRQSDLREAIANVLNGQQRKAAIDSRAPVLAEPVSAKPGLNILVAEDNSVNQRLAMRMLEKLGHQVTLVATGRQAVETLTLRSFDLVLMDVQMPEMDGIEATKTVRLAEAGTGRRQPIVALTAHAMKGDRARCDAAGMDGYLSKPIRPQELEELLQEYQMRIAQPVM